MATNSLETAADLGRAALSAYGAALRNPVGGAAAALRLCKGQVEALTGQSDIAPKRGDKRFRDPIWASNPVYRALMGSYLSLTDNVDRWLDDLDVDQRTKLRLRLLTSMAADTASPTNALLGNPEALQATLQQGGGNLVEGVQHLIDDMANNNGLPSMVDKSRFTVGGNLATTEGQVIYREAHLELIQYAPTTEKVFARPIFIVPPQINKYYIWDLSPGRSVVEFLLSQGHQVFIVSWRNPDEQCADWDMESYVMALDRASAVVCAVSGSQDLNLVGACSGGVTAALLLAYWAGKGAARAHSFTKLVAILDIQGAKDTTMGLFANFETLELARLFSRSRGVLKGQDLQKAFAWLRPNDLIWSYWVNNYLLGKEPPAFDILYWNADTTNLPAALHEDMLDLMAEGGLRPGSTYTIDGVRIDLRSVGCDTYVLAGETDHITPWEGCYQSMQAFGGKSEFVLSQSGHVQAIINPPGSPKARYLTNAGRHSAPEEFRAGAEQHAGSWWAHWSDWLAQRSGAEVDAPAVAGSDAYGPLAPAPGTYVHATA